MSYASENLSSAERERLARDCFQVKEQRGDELHGLCPFHAEKKPSFSYNVGKDLCHCLSCGAGGDLVTLWGQANGYSDNAAAFAAFRARFGHDCASAASGGRRRSASSGTGQRGTSRTGGQGAAAEEVTKVIAAAEWDRLPVLDAEWQHRCVYEFGWSVAVIDGIGLRLWTSPQGEQRIAIPIRRDGGDLVNIRLYRPGAGDNKIISWGKGYGKSKLFPAPDQWQSGPLLLCEGEKDCLCALSHGFNAVTQTAGCNSWDDKFTRFFSGREVVIVYDADQKGLSGAQKVAGKLVKVAASVRLVVWPDNLMPMVEDHGQDLTDYFMVHGGTPQKLRDLIAVTPTVPVPSERAAAIQDDVRRFFGGARGTQFKPRLVANEVMTWRRLINETKSGVIYTWNDKHWEEYDQANIRRHVLSMLDIEGTTPRVNDVLGIVRDLAAMPHGRALNDKAEMIPLANGMFSTEQARILPHDPEHLNTYCIDLNLHLDGKALPDCPTWRTFLEESVGDPDTIGEIQKFFGYCYTRETRYEKALLLIGPGGDGKGTILKVLQSLLGEVNVSNVSLGALEDQFHRVMLVDKLLNVATEIEAGLLQSDMFKTITSGEAITSAYKHRNAFSFHPVCKLAFSANKHPNVQDTSEGLYRRLLLVEMDKQFVKSGRADLYLFDKLMAERAGIFLWGLRGLQRLRADGFRESAVMQDNLDRFKELNNPVLAFVNTHIEVQPREWTCIMEVYRKYAKFCEKRGYKPLGEARFGIELKKCCSAVGREREGGGRRRWGYKGINLVDHYETI